MKPRSTESPSAQAERLRDRRADRRTRKAAEREQGPRGRQERSRAASEVSDMRSFGYLNGLQAETFEAVQGRVFEVRVR